MKKGGIEEHKRDLINAVSASILGLTVAAAAPIYASDVNTVNFSAATVGTTKSIGTWGVDTAWPDYSNVRLSIGNLGINTVKAVRVTFDVSQPITVNANGTFSLDSTAKAEINAQLALAALANPNTPLTFVPTGYGASTTNSMYLSSSGGVNTTTWAEDIEATQQYINAQPGFTNTQISSVEAFNEPDWSSGEGTPAQLNTIIGNLKNYSAFTNTTFVGASTLSPDNAGYWYSQIPNVDQGSSHLLGGSLNSYVNFIQSVDSSGKTFSNPEMHSLSEAIVGANYGQAEGIYWANAMQAKGLFAQVSSSGTQVAYSQDLNAESAAAVYRSATGQTYAFAGGTERFGAPSSYRFVSDRAAYINGIGPIKSYTLQTNYNDNPATSTNDFANFGASFSQGAFATVDFGSSSVPALDGYRWRIENVQTGQVLNVVNNGTSDLALINTAGDTGSLNQLWNITRTQDGYLELYNANSGLAVDNYDGSLNTGNRVDQYSMVSENQQWYITPAGNGTFYLRNTFSNNYLTGNSTDCTTNAFSSSNAAAQQWRFVLANPTSPAIASYRLDGNTSDSTGNYNATVNGPATYVAGPTSSGQALNFNGSNTYVTLPANLTSGSSPAVTNAITVDTWVYWNGGSGEQRIFDFGSGAAGATTGSYMYLTPSTAASGGGGLMQFGITTAGYSNEEDIASNPLVTGQWVNVALTLGGHTAILYLNGRPVTAGQILFNPSELGAINDYIGKSQFSADPLFNGSISQFQIYNYALDASQIDNLLNNDLTWTGGQNGNVWDANTTLNFALTSTGVSSVFNQGDRVNFDGTGTSTVVINSTVSPFSVDVTGGSSITFTGSGSISGSDTPLTMSGTGVLTIANTGGNTYTGDTTINSGVVSISANNDLGADASNLNLNGGTLQTTSASSMVFTHSILVTPAGGTLSIIGNGTTNYGQADRVVTYASNTLIGSGALTVTGDGTLAGTTTNTGAGALVLNASNTYSGNMTLRGGGLLEYAAASALDPIAKVTLGNEGELAASNGSTVPNAIIVNGGTDSVLSFTNTAGVFSGPITLNAGLTIGLRNWYNYGDVQNGTISGVISGNGGLTINSGTGSGGVLTLSGPSTYTGNILVSASTLDAAFGYNSNYQTASPFGNPNQAGKTVTINNGGTVALTVGNVLGGGGETNAPALAFIVNQGGTLETATSAIGTVASGNTGQGDANIFGNITLNGGTFTTGNGYSAAYQSAILLGTVAVGGTVGSTINTDATNTVANGVMLGTTGGTTFNVGSTGASGADLTVSAPLVNSNSGGAGALIKAGIGTMLLSGNNTYTGLTTITAGTLSVSGSIADSSAVIVDSGGTLAGNGVVSAITLNAGGEINPGLGNGTLKASSLAWNSNDSLSGIEFNLSDPSALSGSGLIALTNALTKGTGRMFYIDFTGGQVGNTYTLISFGSSSFNQNMFKIYDSNYAGSFVLGSNSLDFTLTAMASPVPEPATVSMMLAAGMLLLARRKKRMY